MDLAAILKRIERRLKIVGIKAHRASMMAGKPDAIRNIRRAVKAGSRTGISTSTMSALAGPLRTTAAWLIEGMGPEDPTLTARVIPVWGRAGAGGAVFNFREGNNPIDEIPAPADANESTSAIELLGESLGKLFDKWYAIYDEVRHPPTLDMIGHLCVLETATGQVFIKGIQKGRGKRFRLESNFDPPIYDVQISWAAKVKSLIQR